MKLYDTKCPRCKAGIFNLIQVKSIVTEDRIFLDKACQVAVSEIGPRDDGEVIHYECPSCEEVVCYSFAEAEAILRGERN